MTLSEVLERSLMRIVRNRVCTRPSHTNMHDTRPTFFAEPESDPGDARKSPPPRERAMASPQCPPSEERLVNAVQALSAEREQLERDLESSRAVNRKFCEKVQAQMREIAVYKGHVANLHSEHEVLTRQLVTHKQELHEARRKVGDFDLAGWLANIDAFSGAEDGARRQLSARERELAALTLAQQKDALEIKALRQEVKELKRQVKQHGKRGAAVTAAAWRRVARGRPAAWTTALVLAARCARHLPRETPSAAWRRVVDGQRQRGAGFHLAAVAVLACCGAHRIAAEHRTLGELQEARVEAEQVATRWLNDTEAAVRATQAGLAAAHDQICRAARPLGDLLRELPGEPSEPSEP